MGAVRRLAARAIAPWRPMPCVAGVLGPQVESLDVRVHAVESAIASMRADLAAFDVRWRAHEEVVVLLNERIEAIEDALRAHLDVRSSSGSGSTGPER